MHVRLIAVGDRQPAWVNEAFSDYQGRLPGHWKFRLDAIASAPRTRSGAADAAKAAEGQRVLQGLRPADLLVLLDERGTPLSSRELSGRLSDWQAGGRDLCFVIGGPDGVTDELRARADFCWSLSKMTLPHGLARVMFAEQIYRAWTLTEGHPYHRD